MMIAVNPVVGAINTGLNNFLSSMSGTSSILLGAVLGGMMSIDMGGPFNKAAYVFGTAQLTVANAGPEQYAIMAAVMAGGVGPPPSIAFALKLLWLEEWYLHLRSHFVQHSLRIVSQRVKENLVL